MEIKECCKCNLIKNIIQFKKQTGSKDGYYCVCKECKKKYDIEYRRKNKEKIKEYQKIHYSTHKNQISEKNKEYSLSNIDKIKTYQKKYRDSRKEINKIYNKKYRESNKTKRNDNDKKRKQNYPLYKLTCNLRIMISKSFTRNGYCKKSKTAQILGCTFDEFKTYLESKFEPWMNWDNHGLYNGTECYGWDIDHIIPLATAITEEDVIKLNHHTNLQPLCSKINRDVKRNNY
jgi:hypothetical protein